MPVVNDLPMDKECLFSGLPMGTCAHCRGDDLDDLLADDGDPDDYEVTAIFDSQYHGRCTINSDHRIRPKDRIGYVQHADNPMLPVRGVACQACIRDMRRAK